MEGQKGGRDSWQLAVSSWQSSLVLYESVISPLGVRGRKAERLKGGTAEGRKGGKAEEGGAWKRVKE